MKKVLPALIAFIPLAAVAFRPAPALAAECDLSSKVAALAAVQKDNSLSDLQELQAEVRIRRDLLGAAIACDQNDLAVRKDAVERLPDDAKALPAYRQIMEGFADASHYYDKQKEAIPDLGLQGTKDVSRAIASWRQGTYVPLLTRADDLLLWAGNRQFLDRVSSRLAQVSRVAFSLKLVDQDQIVMGFQKAQENFKKASDENDAARDALNEGQTESAHAHIKAALKALSDVYQTFFDLQDNLQKIVK